MRALANACNSKRAISAQSFPRCVSETAHAFNALLTPTPAFCAEPESSFQANCSLSYVEQTRSVGCSSGREAKKETSYLDTAFLRSYGFISSQGPAGHPPQSEGKLRPVQIRHGLTEEERRDTELAQAQLQALQNSTSNSSLMQSTGWLASLHAAAPRLR